MTPWAVAVGMACVVLADSARAGDARTIYVSPHGNDAWSGQRAAPNDAGTDGPLLDTTPAGSP